MDNDSQRPRTPLSARLDALVSDSSSTRSSSPSPSSRASADMQRSAATARHSAKNTALPVLRWLTSGKKSPSSGPAEAMQDALNDDIIAAGTFESATPLVRPPPTAHLSPFYDSLTRSTLPTSSVSNRRPSVTRARTSTDAIMNDNPTVVTASQSPPSRTSLESLRDLRRRSLHNSATQQVQASPSRWWFQNENKKDVDTMLDDDDRKETVQDEAEHIRSKYKSPRNPLVFCHGLLGFDNVKVGPAFAPVNVSHWRGIREVMETNEVEVLMTRVPATSSIEERAKVLEERISEVYSGREIHLIGHSMGGLDCRFLASRRNKRSFKILSITTVATPHRGSVFADYFLQNVVGHERVPTLVSLLDLLPNGGGDGQAFESLTVDRMRIFNEETPDVPGIQYFSWGACYQPGLFDTFRWPHTIILEKEGPNDGLVSIGSAKWGTYLGTLENVDHLDTIGWVNAARYKLAEWTGREVKFKPATFYLGIADHLARVVEGQQDEQAPSEPSKNTAAETGELAAAASDPEGNRTD